MNKSQRIRRDNSPIISNSREKDGWNRCLGAFRVRDAGIRLRPCFRYSVPRVETREEQFGVALQAGEKRG
ncbi:hypothetical protein PR202_gb10504 [Eleusine coracana subsp. coracana]|uniref:Uncharacterized protein n=1 Tax=Eleusine coracana subsp. coracana TaxID=191504 RepID=A0AAV5EI64_ELECO|nr:hypothetical protein PR202_gb10504 [Eleusine coracana subsp. coracana]